VDKPDCPLSDEERRRVVENLQTLINEIEALYQAKKAENQKALRQKETAE